MIRCIWGYDPRTGKPVPGVAPRVLKGAPRVMGGCPRSYYRPGDTPCCPRYGVVSTRGVWPPHGLEKAASAIDCGCDCHEADPED